MASGKYPPIKNAAWRISFPILDADGDLVSGTGNPDSERSIDSGTFADCSNEVTEIATSSGMYYLDLNASEMNGDTISIIVKSDDGKTTPIVVYPVSGSFNEIYSDTTIIASDVIVIDAAVSDVESSLVIVKSDLIVIDDAVSDVESSLVIVKSDLVIVVSDTTAIESELILVHSETTLLEDSAKTIVSAAAAAGTLSTTQMTTNLTETTNDHYNGRIVIWTSGVLQNQATDITDYDGGTKMLTFTAVTEAPGDGDTFVIV